MIGPISRSRAGTSQGVTTLTTPPAPAIDRGKLLFASANLTQKIEQLPLVWRRKEGVRPAFRAYTADLLYDLQVYRTIFDELDRQLAVEPEATRRRVQDLALEAEYPRFARFLDEQLAALAGQVAGFSRVEHELHGFFFRRQLWDVILSSELMTRTNLRPRGYAGDSVMMKMVYDRDARGPTIFARMMHKHPIEQPAAQAVRNRRDLMAARIASLGDRIGPDAQRPARVLSVACGPAAELVQVLRACRAPAQYDVVLLDQDPVALDEARRGLAAVEAERDLRLEVSYVRGSVRTLQQNAGQLLATGGFDLVYSMGLFDYLTPPVGREVLRALFELLADDGSLVVGNFHPDNPDRLYMEYWLDWVLYYRDEAELYDLAAPLAARHIETFFEATGAQGFLLVHR